MLVLSISGLKLAAVLAVCVLALGVNVYLIMSGRRRFADYAAVLIVAAALAAFILMIQTEPPGSGGAGSSDFAGSVTLSFDASAVAGRDGVPGDGVMLAPAAVMIREGETVLEASLRAARDSGLTVSLDAAGAYVTAVGGIGERDFGAYSGWVLYVNGDFPSVGADKLAAADGDVIEWKYTTGEEFE